MRKSQLQIWKKKKPGIADEVALGVTYNEIDDYLEGKQVSPEAQATIEKMVVQRPTQTPPANHSI